MKRATAAASVVAATATAAVDTAADVGDPFNFSTYPIVL